MQFTETHLHTYVAH